MSVDVAALRIVHFPDPILRRKTEPMERVDDEVRAVAERMIVLMQEAPGIGLAAPQVGLDWRLFVVHLPEGDERSAETDPMTATPEPMVFVNPVLGDFSRDLVSDEEGCLSIPGIGCEVRRPTEVTVTALDLDGSEFSLRAQGHLARCFQHEMDHLDGVLMIDRMSMRSRLKNRSAL
ncbi:MAG: peptide deformylase, partial [Planctomycetota bacterium]